LATLAFTKEKTSFKTFVLYAVKPVLQTLFNEIKKDMEEAIE